MSSLLRMRRAPLPSTRERPPTKGWPRLAASCLTGQLLPQSSTEIGAETLRALVRYGATTSLATGA